MGGDHGLRRPPLVSKRRLDPLDDRRHHRQAVGPALLVAIIERSQQIGGDFVDPIRVEWHGDRAQSLPRPWPYSAFPRANARGKASSNIMPESRGAEKERREGDATRGQSGEAPL